MHNFHGAFDPGAKAYLLVTGDLWEDSKWLSTLIRVSAEELPLPKSKPKKSIELGFPAYLTQYQNTGRAERLFH